MIQRQTGETISSNFAVHFYLSLRQKIAFLRILPYTFALFYRRNSPFFIFHRTFALFSTAEFYLSSFLIVHLRLSLRRNFTFSISPPYTCAISFGGILPFFISHRTFAPFSTAEFHFFHFPAVHLCPTLRQKFIFLFPYPTLALFSTAEIHFFISLPYTYSLFYCRNSPFFLFHRTLAPYSTAGIHFFISPPYTYALFYRRNSFFHFPAVHLLSFLLQKFAFLHFPPYTCALLYGRNSFFQFPAVHLRSFLPQDFTFHGFQPKITAENSSSPLPAVLPYKELFSPSIIFHLKSGEVHPRIIPHPR